jgi:hypothetical protein
MLRDAVVTTPASSTSDSAPAATDAAPDNLASTQGLNGAQIAATLQIVADVTAGKTPLVIARELFLALGIAEDKVDRMIGSKSRSSAKPLNVGVEAKGFAETASDFATTFARFTQENALGDKTTAALRILMRQKLYDSGLQSYRDGLQSGGTDWDDLDAEARADARRKVAEWLASQTEYITAFVTELRREGLSETEMAARADLWINKSLKTIYFAGQADAGATTLYRWKLGNTEEHCDTCLTLNGQVHSMKAWVKSGYLPGASTLECKGYNCDCGLEIATGKEVGSLPSARPSLGDRLLGWVRGLFKGGR